MELKITKIIIKKITKNFFYWNELINLFFKLEITNQNEKTLLLYKWNIKNIRRRTIYFKVLGKRVWFFEAAKKSCGNRIYSEKDLQTLKLIKSFIRDEKLSVKEANNRLKNLLKSNEIEHYLPNTMAEKPVTNSGSKQKENK